VKGKNPFKDKRVRQAFYQAIDVNAINKTVMRGLSVPTAINLPTPTGRASRRRWTSAIRTTCAAKKLLAEAGYPNGFELSMDCPNNRYINDEKICVAVAGMLAKIGVNVKVNAIPRAQYFPKAQRMEISFYMLGWGGAHDRRHLHAAAGAAQPQRQGRRRLQLGQLQGREFDALIDDAKQDMDPKRRQETHHQGDAAPPRQRVHDPLHLQVIPWASRANVSVIHRADNWLQATWVTSSDER
jgi:peptide/nickel transport system substrate-binding protein